MGMLRLAVCDDEAYMREELVARLAGYMDRRGWDCRVDAFSGGRELLESREDFQMVFLDIQMPEPDGMETGRLLRERGYEGLLVFITVLEECVFHSFEVTPFDYLLKPVEEERFCRTMDRAMKRLQNQAPGALFVQAGTVRRIIPFPEILYCEVIGRKIYLHQKSGEIVEFYQRLDRLEQQLDARFFRCHRSYLVNLEHVCGYQSGQILLSDGGKIPVSRLREQELSRAILLHMKGER